MSILLQSCLYFHRYLPTAPDSLLAHLNYFHNLLHFLKTITQSESMENNLSAEGLSTPVTITRGELNQLSHAFNNYQAMAEQVQSLATQIAQLRLLMATPASTPESSTIRTATLSQVPKVLQPDPFTGDRLELDTYLTRCQHVFLTQPSLFLTE